jgi:hypothetical protein
MRTVFADLQNEDNPDNGLQIDDPQRARELLTELASKRVESACQFTNDSGRSLIVGVGPSLGFVQYTSDDGLPPYLMAMAASTSSEQRDLEFAIGDTMTPIAGKYLVPIEVVAAIVEDFIAAGQRSDRVAWAEFE